MFKVITIVILSILIMISYAYLQFCIDQKRVLLFHEDTKALLLQKKEILLNDIDEFVFDDYFTVLDSDHVPVSYEINDDTISIQLNGAYYEYPYTIREKEKEIVEITVYKEIYHESTPDPNTTVQNAQTPSSVSNEHYLNLYKNSLSYPLNTKIDKIISDLSSCFESNANVMIDFSHLNCSANGSYPVYFRYDDKQKEIIVHIT